MKSGGWDILAPGLAAESQAAYDSAMNRWKLENDRLFFLRNYDQTMQFALISDSLARETIRMGQKKQKEMNEKIPARLKEVRKMAAEYNRLYKQVPLSNSMQDQLAKGKIYLEESQKMLDNQNFEESLAKAEEAAKLIERVSNFASKEMQDYFQGFPTWEKQVKAGIANSASHKSTLLVVDKYHRICRVYQSGKMVREFEVELGPNWIGDKQYQGDQSTPEGLYRITNKKSGGQTKYHKALLLDYPNQADKERFNKNKQAGRIARNARIGNLIEIHGQGGKGFDWTNGCVALTNKDMDDLYKLVSAQTQVIIVGSLKSWSAIVNSL